MTGPRVVIMLPPSGFLEELNIDREALAARLREIDVATDIALVDDWSDVNVEGLDSGTRFVLVGRDKSLAHLPGAGRQVPVDLADELAWMSGDRVESTTALAKAAALEAALSRDLPRRRYEPSRRVLVWGRGRTADLTAQTLDACGLQAIRTEDELLDLEGYSGSYRVLVGNGSEPMEAGGLVLCGFDDTGPQPESAGHATTLVDLETQITRGTPPWSGADHYGLAFLVGLDRAAGTGAMRRVLQAALAARASGVATYVIAPQVKVASPGLERLYGRARQAGIVFVRPGADGLDMNAADGDRTVFAVYDPVAKARLRLTADLVVSDPALIPDPAQVAAAERLGLETGGDGFIGPDNVLFLSAVSNRAGVAIVGPARGSDDPDVIRREMHSAADELDRLLRPAELPEGRLVVDRGRCTICLTCFRFCPAMAIAFTNRPWAEPMACVECGLCVAECPMDALQLEDYSDAQVKARLEALLSRPRIEAGPPRIVLFGCRRSAVAARAAAPESKIETDVVFVPLPCAGRIEDDLVLTAFVMGADGVLVAACHEGNCRTVRGSGEARRRSGHTADLLAEAGLDPKRLRFTTLAPNMGSEFTAAVEEFTRGLRRGEES